MTVPFGRGEVVTIERARPASMINVLGAELPAVLLATTVKVKVPVASGVPEITPVVEFRDNPVGKLPLVML